MQNNLSAVLLNAETVRLWLIERGYISTANVLAAVIEAETAQPAPDPLREAALAVVGAWEQTAIGGNEPDLERAIGRMHRAALEAKP